MISHESYLYKAHSFPDMTVFLSSVNSKRVTVNVQCLAGSETLKSFAIPALKL